MFSDHFSEHELQLVVYGAALLLMATGLAGCAFTYSAWVDPPKPPGPTPYWVPILFALLGVLASFAVVWSYSAGYEVRARP